MDINRVVQVYIDVPVGTLGAIGMADNLAPGGIGKDYSGAKAALEDTLRTVPANPARAGLQVQNQDVTPLVLAFWHSETSYTPFVLAPAHETGKAGGGYTMAFFRFTGKVSVHGATGSRFGLMEFEV